MGSSKFPAVDLHPIQKGKENPSHLMLLKLKILQKLGGTGRGGGDLCLFKTLGIERGLISNCKSVWVHVKEVKWISYVLQ